MVPQPSTCTPNVPGNVPKVLQNRPQTASRKDFPTPSKPNQKGKQATYKFHQPSFPKQPIQHAPPLQHTAQQTEKARSNGQKAQKARFHRRNTEARGSRKADGNRFLSEKDMYAEKQTGKNTIRFTPTPNRRSGQQASSDTPPSRHTVPFRPNGAIRCISHRSAVHRPLQRAAMSFAAQCV